MLAFLDARKGLWIDATETSFICLQIGGMQYKGGNILSKWFCWLAVELGEVSAILKLFVNFGLLL